MAQQLAPIEVISTGDHANTPAIGQYDFQARMEAAQSLLTSDVQILSRPHRKELDQLVRDCRRAIQALEQGFEPTTPPEKWVAGFIRRPGWRHRIALRHRYEREAGCFPYEHQSPRWPRETTGSKYRLAYRVFTAPKPLAVMPKINEGLRFFGNDELRIYSLGRGDFGGMSSPLASTPVVIGRLLVGGESIFFEVARWHAAGSLSVSYDANAPAPDVEESRPSAKEMAIDHVTDVVYGWRRYTLSWRRGGWLLAGSYQAWESREKTAKCQVQSLSDDFTSPEHDHCECGIYSIKDREDLPGVLPRANVDALVVMWGTVREYENGYRAEHVRIEKLYIPEAFHQKHNTHGIDSQLKNQFGFEVELEWMKGQSA